MRSLVTLIWLASVSTLNLAWAAEPAPAKPAEPAPATAKSTPRKPDEKPVAKAEEEKAATQAEEEKTDDKASAAKSPADQRPSPQRFIPSEQVRADFDVSFPIDI
jgi:hypothetical protein